MSKLSKALIAAAGNVGGAALYSDDVFSTYLYTGNGASQTIENGIALGDTFVGTSTLFDGGTDYLSRSSDLTGNADSGTFTLSFWLRPTSLALDSYVYRSGTGFQFWVSSRDNGGVDVIGYDSGGSKRLEIGIAAGTCSVNSWTHVLVSVDLSDTGSRYVYINDAAVTPSYFVYQNASINFTNTAHGIAADSTGGSKYTGYLAHFYLDYTYRNLSVEANRRYFIDGNGCATSEATQSALSPILYLPLTDSTTANSGTGGNFTANGSPSIEDKGVGYEAGYGSGGMVWVKGRDTAYDHRLFDTDRGAGKMLSSNNTGAEQTLTEQLEAFNSDGFQVGNNLGINGSGNDYASWTFRKAEKFFDVVTYTGNGTAGHTISHNLGAVPAVIIVKRLDGTGNWAVYHKDADATSPEDKYFYLNTTAAVADAPVWNDYAPTDTDFQVGSYQFVNNSGSPFVAYLFASDAGGFGDDGSESIIKCGSWDATGNNEVNLGFEPQWILIKNADGGNNWGIFDSMRGWTADGNMQVLTPNLSNAESSESGVIKLTSTGFTWIPAVGGGNTYIYIAIRRPMKTPESGTEVFNDTFQYGEDGKTGGYLGSPADLDIRIDRTGGGSLVRDRLRGDLYLRTQATDAEAGSQSATWDNMTGYFYYSPGTSANTNIIHYVFKRATGFFDVACHTSDGVTESYPHNLGVIPELKIIKNRGDGTVNWVVGGSVLGAPTNRGYYLYLNTNSAMDTNDTFFDQNDTASVYGVRSNNSSAGGINNNNYVVYLFATLAGVSKVGSYTGNGTSQTIDCGFSAGARFVLIKRTDANGDWNVFDTERGIVTGTDNILPLNNTAGESAYTDVINPNAAGFEVTSNTGDFNLSGASYIFLAIA